VRKLANSMRRGDHRRHVHGMQWQDGIFAAAGERFDNRVRGIIPW
jgi:hypothetical protein